MSEVDPNAPNADPNASANTESPPARRRRSGKTETVTYLPREGDNPKTTWHGLTFHANVPKEVSLDTHSALVESAKNNKFFKVGTFDPDKDTVAAEETVEPKTAEQYRVHCIAWLNKCESDTDFVERWMAEEKLREECGVGTDDIDYLNSLIAPKRSELKKRALGE